ncbi:glycosyl hydrolase, partial [Tanacetum coccineum]
MYCKNEGHYLSASAQMWASIGNDTLKKKMTAVVSTLAECQEKIGTGYLSAFTSKFFDRFEAIKPVWAPYYTIHKIMASLVDQYVLAGNNRALKMVTQMADYFYERVQNVITEYTIERHWLSLNEETGGMNYILYRDNYHGDQYYYGEPYYHGKTVEYYHMVECKEITVVILVRDRCPRGKDNLP